MTCFGRCRPSSGHHHSVVEALGHPSAGVCKSLLERHPRCPAQDLDGLPASVLAEMDRDVLTREVNAALNGREPQMRDLLTRLNDFVGVLATQRDNINATVDSLNRLSGTFAGQRDVLTKLRLLNTAKAKEYLEKQAKK